MNKNQFCDKWQRGWVDFYVDGTEEQMQNDLDRLVYDTMIGWKKFFDSEVCKSIDLNDWERMETEAVEKRRDK